MILCSLNKHVKNDPYPMPSIDSVIEKIGTAKYISKIDLTRAFWQIPLTENCRLATQRKQQRRSYPRYGNIQPMWLHRMCTYATR